MSQNHLIWKSPSMTDIADVKLPASPLSGASLEKLNRASSTIGLIDIGSNSIRLVIYRSGGKFPHPQFNEREVCRLGMEVNTTGMLGESQMTHALETLNRFAMLARLSKVDVLEAFATEAVRRANNSKDFLAKAEAILGITIMVISGQQEAFLSASGVCAGFRDPCGVVADLGGGSLELVRISEGKTIDRDQAASLPCGYLVDYDMAAIDDFLHQVTWLPFSKGQRFYAVGGVWRAIATAYSFLLKPRLDIVHGLSITPDQLEDMMASIEDKQGQIHGIPPARRPNMTQAIRLTRALITHLEPSEIIFSAFGVREGMLYDCLDLDHRGSDPLMDGVKEYAVMTSRFPQQGETLEQLVLQCLDSYDADTQRLAVACCYLCDLAWIEHPDHRARLAVEKMLGLSVNGITHMERVWMAVVLYARYEGVLPIHKNVMSILPSAARKTAKTVGLLLRMLMTFSGGITPVLEQITITKTKKGFALAADPVLLGSGDLLQRRIASVNRTMSQKITLVQ
jgi:exopolyphosphatase/guanosine-5'-triphosphate,3'-diphosphate pyrophosphatase